MFSKNTLGKFTAASLATAVAASLSMGVSAQEWEQDQQQQGAQQESEFSERSTHEKDYGDKKIVEVLDEKDRFSKFREALKQADMKDELNGDDEYTVFAPTNDAFERLPEGTWDAWMDGDNQDELRDVLSYHIVEDRKSSGDFSEEETEVSTKNGDDLRISSTYGTVMVNYASVAYEDIEAENGYIHGIDTVLMDNQRQGQMTGAE